ncbi:unnamed protein product [Schistosoma curassoni]|uniref:Rubis-subs-bind domain-containing protein n=1 Tax=Schistosoma curassoni TaxID=6186 RepID=A0A183KL88_9TREM|nr:unnamed protein product [Schistosoma curassoni]
MEAYKPGDQIFMDYGNRSNEDFFMFSGFIPHVNLNNKLTITLGNPLKCDLRGDIESMTEFLIFSRIFCMDKDELNKYLVDSKSNHIIMKLELSSFEFNKEIACEHKALSFMINRLKLLIAAYGTLLLEDTPEWNQLTLIQQNCERLKHHEVNILRSSIENIQNILDSSYNDNFPFTYFTMFNTMQSHPLFDGAFQCLLPTNVVDASDLRQIPDNQEVFVHPSTSQSITIDILEYVDASNHEDAARMHFDEIGAANEATDSNISSLRTVSLHNPDP